MLRVIEDPKEIAIAQRQLMRNLKSQLPNQGPQTIGYQGGNTEHPIYAVREGGLYYAYSAPRNDVPIVKHWNSFGIFRPKASSQEITVEINIPTDGNRARVAGFFATEPGSRRVFLLHDGSIGGGRKGIGRDAFLGHASMPVVIAATMSGSRNGLVIGDIADPNLAALVWRFVRVVSDFKHRAVAGTLPDAGPLPTPEATYSAEFWGAKSGSRKDFNYISYHGLVVDELRKQREQSLGPGERVGNTGLIDLYVASGSKRIEIYEVKSSIDRQSLYGGIGQLMTHAPEGKRTLVLPPGKLPADLTNAIERLSIEMRRFDIEGKGADARIKLL